MASGLRAAPPRRPGTPAAAPRPAAPRPRLLVAPRLGGGGARPREQTARAQPGAAAGGAPFNFAPASARDSVVFGCCMAGYCDPPAAPAGRAAVAEWADFMRSKGITDVVVLLGDDELSAFFEPPGLEALLREAGFKPHMLRARSAGAHGRIMAALDSCEAAGRRAAVHCSAGEGRVGLVLTAWLAHRHGLSYEDAAAEVVSFAAAAGAERRAPARERFDTFVSGAAW